MITFGEIEDTTLGLALLNINTGSPEPALVLTEIPGMNGVLDQSEAVAGFTTYKEREITMLFTLAASTASEYQTKLSTVKNLLHGKRNHIAIDTDPDYYYDVRTVVEAAAHNAAFGEITVSGQAYPYKRKTDQTVITQTITGTGTVLCNNEAEPVVPEITISDAMKIEFDGKSFEKSAGTYLFDILFSAGENVLTVTGTGDITVKYREGSL